MLFGLLELEGCCATDFYQVTTEIRDKMGGSANSAKLPIHSSIDSADRTQ